MRARTGGYENQWLRARSDPGPFDKSNGPGSLLDDISVSNCVVYAQLVTSVDVLATSDRQAVCCFHVRTVLFLDMGDIR